MGELWETCGDICETFWRRFGDVLIFLVRNVWETVGRPLGDIWISLGDVYNVWETFGRLWISLGYTG